MTATTAEPASRQRGGLSWLIHRQLDYYPATSARLTYLAITVLATIMLYYELYVGGSVSTLILPNFHMSFTFYVLALAFGNLIGAFGSLFAGLTDRFGRANLVVFGLLFTAIFVTWVLPAAPNKWAFVIEGFVVGVVEGICLVATPALIRDFSPQVGRATAMGFWTSGPVLGSLIVSVVGTWTIPATENNPAFWSHEYRICGYAGIVVFVIALIGLRELSPQLRDQLMVTMRDRALIEARAKGIDIAAALRHPWRQLLKADIIISAIAVSIMLLIYYTAVGFGVIYLNSVFGVTLKNANALGNWNWGFNAIGVILIGIVSDRFRVRKPFMVIGAVLGAVMVVFYLEQAGHHPTYYTLAIMLALMAFGLGVAYTPWMASYTETVEHRNPALIATGLAIWGWVIRVIIFLAFLLIPVVINTVTPLVDYGTTVQTYAAKYPSLVWAGSHPIVIADVKTYKALGFAQTHPTIVATAKTYRTQAANAQRLAPELAVIQAHQKLFLQAAKYPTNKIPAALAAKLVKAAGGGLKGLGILATISANQAAIQGVIAAQAQLLTLKPYTAQLEALNLVPPAVIKAVTAPGVSGELAALQKVPVPVQNFMAAHASDVVSAKDRTAGQWRTWYWVCFAGIVFFLFSIPLLRGRWLPRNAKRDEAEHEAMVQAELAKLGTS
jgi:ACS family D-galactonate transporter-like MFS transporter